MPQLTPLPASCLTLALTLALATVSAPVRAEVPCGGSFAAFVEGVRNEARANGLPETAIRSFFSGVQQNPAVLKADRAQGVFRKDFLEFSRAVISQNRLTTGAAQTKKQAGILAQAEAQYGVAPGVLLAFWALETDFGAVQGDFNTRDALVTLAHDCRRPALFRPQVLAAILLQAQGDFDTRMTGAWAGEIGQVQMLPADILRNGVDGDGDGHIRLKTSSADALMSGAKMLAAMGWRRGEPWLQEVELPMDLDWRQTGLEHSLSSDDWAARGVRARSGSLAKGLPASVLLPMGRKGPAFLAYPNFQVLFEWNQSFVYVTTAAYFATRLSGAPVVDPGKPEPGLSASDMARLQEKLAARGHAVGKADGILGAKTRSAVQREQERLGLPADAWPTKALLDQL
jgi:lytic murein transglycosylase